MESSHYNRLFSETFIPIVILELTEFRFVDCNKAAIAIYGFSSKEEVLGKTPFDVSTPTQYDGRDSIEAAREFINKCKSDGSISFEWRHQRPNGDVWDAEVNLMLYEFAGQLMMHFSLQDITEKKKAQQLLMESESRYKKLVNAMGQGLAIHKVLLDEAGKVFDYVFIDINEHYEVVTGLKRDAVIGKTVRQVLPNLEQYWIDTFGKVALTGDSVHYENFVKELNKTYDTIVFKPFENHFAVIVNDVTERRRVDSELVARNIELQKAKQKAEESESRFRKVVEHLPIGVAYEENGRLFVNHSLEITTGYSRLDFTTTKDWVLYLANNFNENVDFEDIISGNFDGKELLIETKDNIRRWVEITAFSDNNIRIWLVNDITQRKLVEMQVLEKKQEIEAQNEEYLQMNEELQQANEELFLSKERAEESDRLKSAFLANMSHEIRTPMNAIVGFSGLLNDDELTKEEQKSFTDIIFSRSNDLLQIINDVLDFSLLESGNVTMQDQAISLNGLIDEICMVGQQKVNTLGKSIQFIGEKLFTDDKSTIVADNLKFKQIFTNLVDNAIKFTETGSITVGYCMDKHKRLLCYVSDTGIGISPEYHSIIFERFRQARTNNTTRVFGGTGLGLSICKGNVKLLGGDIWVESDFGKGSTFYFSIPYYASEEEAKTKKHLATDNDYNWMGKTILVVEDDEYNLKYLKEVLRDLNVNIMTATSGREVEALYSRIDDVDLVLMDIRLPDTTGTALTRQLKKMRKNLPVVAQTAYAMELDRRKCLEAGCDDYITKPINKDNLYKLLNDMFHRVK